MTSTGTYWAQTTACVRQRRAAMEGRLRLEVGDDVPGHGHNALGVPQVHNME